MCVMTPEGWHFIRGEKVSSYFKGIWFGGRILCSKEEDMCFGAT